VGGGWTLRPNRLSSTTDDLPQTVGAKGIITDPLLPGLGLFQRHSAEKPARRVRSYQTNNVGSAANTPLRANSAKHGLEGTNCWEGPPQASYLLPPRDRYSKAVATSANPQGTLPYGYRFHSPAAVFPHLYRTLDAPLHAGAVRLWLGQKVAAIEPVHCLGNTPPGCGLPPRSPPGVFSQVRGQHQ